MARTWIRRTQIGSIKRYSKKEQISGPTPRHIVKEIFEHPMDEFVPRLAAESDTEPEDSSSSDN